MNEMESSITARALTLINKYIVSFETMRKVCSFDKYHQLRDEQQKYIKALCAIENPLIQAIANKLLLDSHYKNANEMIRTLADDVANAQIKSLR